MNSIRRPRARPRRDSVNFKSLGWAVTRLACWHAIYGASSPAEYPGLARDFCRTQTTPLLYRVRAYLRGAAPEARR